MQYPTIVYRMSRTDKGLEDAPAGATLELLAETVTDMQVVSYDGPAPEVGETVTGTVRARHAGAQPIGEYDVSEIRVYVSAYYSDEAQQVRKRARQYRQARDAERLAWAALSDATTALVHEGTYESDAAELAGVNRLTVRKWLGKDA